MVSKLVKIIFPFLVILVLTFIRDSEPFNWSPVVGTIQIRNSAGRVLSTSPQCGELQSGTVSYNVTAGMKIQLFMDVSTKPGYSRPGDYRKAHFSYYYTIS